MENYSIRVAEMFAGVGGFHLGLNRASKHFDIVWANQYEPARRNQFAYNIYRKNFPKTLIENEDISKLDKSKIPDFDLLVGGFPCQDYSVASSGAKGLYGKKGVLWWDIIEVIKEKNPQFIFLENVDRLLTSPGVKTENAGRDFGMILKTLSKLDYGVTWKMINAADYGFPQKRRRTFIFGFRNDTHYMNEVRKIFKKEDNDILSFLTNAAPFSSTLKNEEIDTFLQCNLNEYDDLAIFSEKFSIKKGFKKTGVMVDGLVYNADYQPVTRGKNILRNIIKTAGEDSSLYLSNEKVDKFKQLKNGFRTTKISKTGYEYKYGMGRVPFPDSLDQPARTMVTTEHTISRMSHVISDPKTNKLRLISPEEAEKINTFPENWTKLDGVSDSNRYFTMGNALVVDLVAEIGSQILDIMKVEDIGKTKNNIKTIEKISH